MYINENVGVLLSLGGPIVLAYAIVGFLVFVFPQHATDCFCKKCLKKSPGKQKIVIEKRMYKKINGYDLKSLSAVPTTCCCGNSKSNPFGAAMGVE